MWYWIHFSRIKGDIEYTFPGQDFSLMLCSKLIIKMSWPFWILLRIDGFQVVHERQFISWDGDLLSIDKSRMFCSSFYLDSRSTAGHQLWGFRSYECILVLLNSMSQWRPLSADWFSVATAFVSVAVSNRHRHFHSTIYFFSKWSRIFRLNDNIFWIIYKNLKNNWKYS